MVVVIPAAGEGLRFLKEGYTLPKPLIEARGVPMIHRVAQMFPAERRIVICQKAYEKEIQAASESEVIPITKLTEGAALSVLCAEALVGDDDPVVVVNSDNIILGTDVAKFLDEAVLDGVDGAILTFKVDSGPWSYARIRGDRVVQVAEKTPISDNATAGVYYFKSWRILRTAVCRMIAANDRFNGEFYLAPAYNYMIGAGMTVSNFTTLKQNFVSLGTPEDLERYNALA